MSNSSERIRKIECDTQELKDIMLHYFITAALEACTAALRQVRDSEIRSLLIEAQQALLKVMMRMNEKKES